MFCFVLLLFVNLNLSVHSNLYTNNNYSIQMTLAKVLHRWNGTEDLQKNFKILRNKSFNITLVNYVATSAKCGTKGYNFTSKFIIDDGDSTIKFSEATKDMTAKWQCAVETNGSVLRLTFYVRVIGGPKEVKIEMAGREISTTVSGSPELAYDELGIYDYKCGETVQLLCKNINDRQHYGDIYLRYYDSKDIILFETDRITNDDSVFFQRTMKPEDNNHAIDCTYVTKDTNLMFPYRVVFKLINDSIDDDFTITINDLKLRSTETNLAGNENMRYYQFTYFRNQILTVSFETSNEQYGSIRFVDEENETPELSSFKEIKATQWKHTVQFHTKSIEKKHYELRVMNVGVSNPFLIAEVLLNEKKKYFCAYKSFGENSKSNCWKAVLYNESDGCPIFPSVSVVSYPELLIKGLTAKDVIDQYRKNRTTWVIDYWCSVGEALYLSCDSRDDRHLRWFFGTSFVHYEYGKIISHNFTSSEECNETSIICEDMRKTENDRRTIINLHRKSAYSVTTEYPSATDEDSDNTILIVCAMAASIVAVTMLGFVFYYCRHRNAKSSQTSTDTLTNGNQYSTPIYSTPMARTSEQNYAQGYMVQNSLYEPNTFDNTTAEYHYIDVKDISKEKYATARPIFPQADNVYVNSFAESQQNENNDNRKKTAAEVGLNPCYANIVNGEEYPEAHNNKEIYNYSYSIRYVNSKNNAT